MSSVSLLHPQGRHPRSQRDARSHAQSLSLLQAVKGIRLYDEVIIDFWLLMRSHWERGRPARGHQ